MLTVKSRQHCEQQLSTNERIVQHKRHGTKGSNTLCSNEAAGMCMHCAIAPQSSTDIRCCCLQSQIHRAKSMGLERSRAFVTRCVSMKSAASLLMSTSLLLCYYAPSNNSVGCLHNHHSMPAGAEQPAFNSITTISSMNLSSAQKPACPSAVETRYAPQQTHLPAAVALINIPPFPLVQKLVITPLQARPSVTQQCVACMRSLA
jgi:hypothetical protein